MGLGSFVALSHLGRSNDSLSQEMMVQHDNTICIVMQIVMAEEHVHAFFFRRLAILFQFMVYRARLCGKSYSYSWYLYHP